MGYNGSGSYSLPAGSIQSDGTTADAADVNTPFQDIETSLSLLHLSDGRKAATGNWPMGGFKHTGLGSGSAATDSPTLAQVQSGVVSHATSVAGTADAIQVSFSPASTSWTTNERIFWKSAGANTLTAPTISKDAGATSKTIKKGASAALVAGDTGASGYECEAVYNGTDLILLNPATQAVSISGTNAFTGANSFAGDTTFTGSIIAALGNMIRPGGRLTLTTAVPVLSSDVTAATTVYYTPYVNNVIALYDGTNWKIHSFSEMSQTLADATKSPAAGAVSSNYDMFVWNDSGTLRCTRGPAWSSGTTRGTGAGTTELERVGGQYVNKVAITNGPAAQRGVYVGTISTSSSGANGQLNMMFAPAAAAGGTANRLDVWNMYNRVKVSSVVRDSTDSWNYTTATFRSANNSTSNRITLIVGLNEEVIDVIVASSSLSSTGGTDRYVGIGIDSTSTLSGYGGIAAGPASNVQSNISKYVGLPGLGSHFLQQLEYSVASGTTTWYGDGGAPTTTQNGIYFTGIM